MPLRIQLRRTRGWRIPENTVKVDRSTKWGNPAKPGAVFMNIPVRDSRHAARLYGGFAPLNPRLVREAEQQLAGKNLGCWCRVCDLHLAGKPLNVECPFCDPCHVDTLGKIANGYSR